jgi:hypothetical protein
MTHDDQSLPVQFAQEMWKLTVTIREIDTISNSLIAGVKKLLTQDDSKIVRLLAFSDESVRQLPTIISKSIESRIDFNDTISRKSATIQRLKREFLETSRKAATN